MNTEQLRAEFEAWAKTHYYLSELGLDFEDDEYVDMEVQGAFEAYQAGRAALQSQKPKATDLMLSAVIRMPLEMAMAGPISRVQFYERAQQALNELEALQSQDREDAQHVQEQPTDHAEFELVQYGVSVASATGKREDAWREIQHYAAVYSQDDPVEIYEVIRRRIEGEAK